VLTELAFRDEGRNICEVHKDFKSLKSRNQTN